MDMFEIIKDALPATLGYRMPTEWEKQDAIWLSWPHCFETFEEFLPQVERDLSGLYESASYRTENPVIGD